MKQLERIMVEFVASSILVEYPVEYSWTCCKHDRNVPAVVHRSRLVQLELDEHLTPEYMTGFRVHQRVRYVDIVV